MGFSSTDDFISEVTTNGKFLRCDFMKIYNGGTVVAGRWYDLNLFGGTPAEFIHGNMVKNYHFYSGITNWTLGSANWAWTQATHLLTRTANADLSTVSQNTDCVNGVSYSVVYTLTRAAGSITVSLGGTAGTARSSSSTFRETIVCGATAGAPLVFTPDATFAGTIDVVAVTRDLGFTPYTDSNAAAETGLWHGGNVSGDTKHVVNMGAWTNTATGAPSVLMLVDMLGCYPRIRTDLATIQNLNNTLTLPRYTNGVGVRPFYSVSVAPGANARNFTMSYTNTTPTSGRSLGALVSATASSIVSHIEYSGVAAGNYGPFLPLTAPDQGVKSVESCQFSGASASAGTIDLVLCKPICSIPITTAFVAAERSLMFQVPSLPRIVDGACLGFLHYSGAVTAAGTEFQGYVDVAWG